MAAKFEELLSTASASVAVIGGLLSIAYVSGYSYAWGYLSRFRAGWLVIEIPTIDILFPAAFIYTILGVVVLIFATQAIASPRPTERFFILAISVYLILTVAEKSAARDIPVAVRFVGWIVATALLAAAAIALLRLAVFYYSTMLPVASNQNPLGETRLAGPIAALGVLLLMVFVPIAIAKTHAMLIRQNPSRWLAHARLRQPSGSRTVLVLRPTPGRVYCVQFRGDDIIILPVAWDDVIEITGPRPMWLNE